MKNLHVNFDNETAEFTDNGVKFTQPLSIGDLSRKLYFMFGSKLIFVNKADYGFNVETDEGIRYYAEMSQQGMIYKNYKAFKEDNSEICYIPEHGFKDDDIVDNSNEWWIHSGKDSYTRKDIEKACEDLNLNKKYAEDVFETVDWQYPESYIGEMIENIEDDEE